MPSCSNESNPVVLKNSATYWTIVPLRTIYNYDDNSGLCFYPDGKLIRYINRYGQRIPYGTYLDVYPLEDIFLEWQYDKDSLIVHKRKYAINLVSQDSIFLLNEKEQLLIVLDTIDLEINWGSKADSVPKKYVGW